MLSVVDVARYILSKFDSVTTMKLQKLTFYAQAHSLGSKGKPLFEEDFQAWVGGPVSPALFQKHRGKFLISPGFLGDESDPLPVETARVIDEVLGALGNKSGNELSDRTHREDPWVQARGDRAPDSLGGDVISQRAIQEFYSLHPVV